jgi:DNA-binding transcriptional LysR family regulator
MLLMLEAANADLVSTISLKRSTLFDAGGGFRHRLGYGECRNDCEAREQPLSEPTLMSQQKLRETFRDAGLPAPRAALECRSTALRLRSVAKSDLLDFTSRSVVRQLADAQVTILPVRELAWRRSVGLLRRKETYLPPVVRRFADILRSIAKGPADSR